MIRLFKIIFRAITLTGLLFPGSLIHAKASVVNPDKKLDSIKNAGVADTQKVTLLWHAAWDWQSTNFEKAKQYLREAEKLALRTGYHKGQIEVYDKMGDVCKNASEYDSAIFYHIKCLKLREKYHDHAGMARSYGNVGLLYVQLNDSVQSLTNLRDALYTDSLYNAKGMAWDEVNLGIYYIHFKKTAMAREWFFKALPRLKAANETEYLARAYNNIGITYFYEGQYKKTLNYFLHAAAIFARMKMIHQLAENYNNIGGVYIAINKDSAYRYLQKALVLARQSGASNTVMSVYGNIRTYYDSLHDTRNAYKYFQLYTDMHDSIFNVQKSKDIAELQTRYDSEKDKEKIASLNASREFQQLLRNSFIVIIIMALIILLVLISRYNRQKRSMKIISEEKAKSESLLLNILPRETAEELKKYGKTKAHSYQDVSVLFSDIKGFTTLSEQLSASDLVEDLDMYFGAFDDIMTRFGIEKIKTIGDAYLAAGGLPNPGADSAADIIRAAIEMQRYVARIKSERVQQQLPYFEIRLGIHTGTVVAGVVGTKKFQFDIWGDTVNTAARMEQNGEPGKINISATTYEKIKDKFPCTPRGYIEAKNKGKMEMYFVEFEG